MALREERVAQRRAHKITPRHHEHDTEYTRSLSDHHLPISPARRPASRAPRSVPGWSLQDTPPSARSPGWSLQDIPPSARSPGWSLQDTPPSARSPTGHGVLPYVLFRPKCTILGGPTVGSYGIIVTLNIRVAGVRVHETPPQIDYNVLEISGCHPRVAAVFTHE